MTIARTVMIVLAVVASIAGCSTARSAQTAPATDVSAAAQGPTIASAITKKNVLRTTLHNLSLMACASRSLLLPTYPAVATVRRPRRLEVQ